ncbi:MAG: ComF family protein [Minisyncoccota bacterium]
MRLTPPVFISKIGILVLDTFFPQRCLSCHQRGTYCCVVCLNRVALRLKQRCPSCLRAITPHGETCFACAKSKALDGLFACSFYHDAILSRAIHTYKYRCIPTLAEPLGIWLAEQVLRTDLALPDCYIPVPLHVRRLRFRGFNQSALLTHVLADTITPNHALPVITHALQRIRYTKPQMKTHSRTERLANLQDAFAIPSEYRLSVQGKRIWLIDDVATTGATLEQCAQALKKAGANSVFAIVLAR